MEWDSNKHLKLKQEHELACGTSISTRETPGEFSGSFPSCCRLCETSPVASLLLVGRLFAWPMLLVPSSNPPPLEMSKCLQPDLNPGSHEWKSLIKAPEPFHPTCNKHILYIIFCDIYHKNFFIILLMQLQTIMDYPLFFSNKHNYVPYLPQNFNTFSYKVVS